VTKIALRDLLAKRSIQAIATIFIVLAIDFAIFHLLPGSIIDRLANNPNLSEAVTDQVVRQFGLDQPLSVQFVAFVSNFLQGQFGVSFFYGEAYNIGAIVGERLINTLFLMIPADIIAIVLGLWIGKVAAWNRGKAKDVAGLLFSLVTYAIPGFWLGMILLQIFGFRLQIVPTDPYNLVRSFSEYEGDILGFLSSAVGHLILPVLVLAIVIFGVFATIMRNSLLEVLSEDYMITAKAKGLTEKEQLNKEAVPNARIWSTHMGCGCAQRLSNIAGDVLPLHSCSCIHESHSRFHLLLPRSENTGWGTRKEDRKWRNWRIPKEAQFANRSSNPSYHSGYLCCSDYTKMDFTNGFANRSCRNYY
jgi:peptide/nickel transport system permease protein